MNRHELWQLIRSLTLILCLATIFYVANYTALGASYRTLLYQLDLWGDHAHGGQTIYLPLVSR